MKKGFSLILLFTIVTSLTACSIRADSPEPLTGEGVAPYKLSDREKYLLQAFGMEGNSQIISFNAPKGAISMYVNVYRLENDRNWGNIGSGAISVGTEREPTDQLAGSFAMQLKEDYAIDFNITSRGRASFSTDSIPLDVEIMASVKGFLTEFQKIEINKEVPVAFMVYDSGTSMGSYSLQDYFEPSRFGGMDLVQMVTLTFSDK